MYSTLINFNNAFTNFVNYIILMELSAENLNNRKKLIYIEKFFI